MQVLAELAEHGAHAAGGEEVLHVVLAGGLEIHQHRGRRRSGAFSVCRSIGTPTRPAIGGEVDDRVGRAADGQQHAQRVLDRPPA